MDHSQSANRTFNHLDSESFDQLLTIEKKNETINDNHDSIIDMPGNNVISISNLGEDNLKEGGEPSESLFPGEKLSPRSFQSKKLSPRSSSFSE